MIVSWVISPTDGVVSNLRFIGVRTSIYILSTMDIRVSIPPFTGFPNLKHPLLERGNSSALQGVAVGNDLMELERSDNESPRLSTFQCKALQFLEGRDGLKDGNFVVFPLYLVVDEMNLTPVNTIHSSSQL